MKIATAAYLVLALLPLGLARSQARQEQDPPEPAIESKLLETASGQLILTHTLVVKAPIQEVWKAYTTEAGWTSWASPQAKIDLRPGGTIRTQYDSAAEVGDPGTITLHVVNCVPERVLTLRAEIADSFPAIMREDDENLMQVTLFEPLGPERTRVTAYGVGYRDVPEYRELIDYFQTANADLYGKLIQHLER